MTELADRVALVTGGARGQGRAHAVALAAAGATVVVCDIADQVPTVRYPMSTTADLDETVRTIGEAGGQARGVVVDVRDNGQLRHLVDDVVARHSRLDVSRAVLYLVTDPGRTSGSVLEVNLATSASRV